MGMRQALWLSSANLRAALARPGLAFVVVLSVALTVLVFDAALSVGFGLSRMLVGTAQADRALFLARTAAYEKESFLYDGDLGALRREEFAVRSPELVATGAHLASKRTGDWNRLMLRGVSAAAFEMRPEVRIVAGRMFDSGRMEMIVGTRAAAELEGVGIGDMVDVDGGNAQYAVVGHFAAGGGPHEDEAWAELPMAQSTHDRNNVVSSLWIRAADAGRFDAIREAVEADPRVDVVLISEREYFQGSAGKLAPRIWALASMLGGLMALGAGAATLCVSYWTVRSRGPQLAALRAMGFGSGALALALALEILALTILGGIVGAAGAYSIFDGASLFMRGATINAEMLGFDLAVTPAVVALGLAAAVAIGLVGALLPLMQMHRLNIAAALQRR